MLPDIYRFSFIKDFIHSYIHCMIVWIECYFKEQELWQLEKAQRYVVSISASSQIAKAKRNVVQNTTSCISSWRDKTLISKQMKK